MYIIASIFVLVYVLLSISFLVHVVPNCFLLFLAVASSFVDRVILGYVRTCGYVRARSRQYACMCVSACVLALCMRACVCVRACMHEVPLRECVRGTTRPLRLSSMCVFMAEHVSRIHVLNLRIAEIENP